MEGHHNSAMAAESGMVDCDHEATSDLPDCPGCPDCDAATTLDNVSQVAAKTVSPESKADVAAIVAQSEPAPRHAVQRPNPDRGPPLLAARTPVSMKIQLRL